METWTLAQKDTFTLSLQCLCREVEEIHLGDKLQSNWIRITNWGTHLCWCSIRRAYPSSAKIHLKSVLAIFFLKKEDTVELFLRVWTWGQELSCYYSMSFSGSFQADKWAVNVVAKSIHSNLHASLQFCIPAATKQYRNGLWSTFVMICVLWHLSLFVFVRGVCCFSFLDIKAFSFNLSIVWDTPFSSHQCDDATNIIMMPSEITP